MEARELVIMLPPSFQEYDPDALLKLFVLKFHNEYGLHCHAGLHHNKAESNYHIHLVYSERKLLEQPEHKIAARNMFYDENGKHRRTKKKYLMRMETSDLDARLYPKVRNMILNSLALRRSE